VIVISDTSPINYLCQIGRIDLLPALFGNVAMPIAVRDELAAPAAPIQVRELATNPPPWLEIFAPRAGDPSLAKLGAGEREAISLAQEIGADLIIMDDLEARRVAESRQLAVIGTIGILKLAAGRRLLDLSQAIESLLAVGFHVSEELIRQLRNDSSQ
jgi:predicted nucleic acid-binding protein